MARPSLLTLTAALLLFTPFSLACKEFDFLEQLLEKVVRFEVKFDSLVKRMDDLEVTMDEKVKELDLSETERNEHVEEVADRLSEKEALLSQTVKEMIGQQGDAIEQLRETCHTKRVMFSAKSVDQDHLLDGRVLRFPHVTMNLGNGYDRHDGYFTAPHSGTYLFHTSVCAKKDKWVYVSIMAKGDPLVTTGTKEEEFNGVCSSASGMVLLRAGDRAWVQGVWNETAAIYHKTPYSTPTFSGALIHNSL